MLKIKSKLLRGFDRFLSIFCSLQALIKKCVSQESEKYEYSNLASGSCEEK